MLIEHRVRFGLGEIPELDDEVLMKAEQMNHGDLRGLGSMPHAGVGGSAGRLTRAREILCRLGDVVIRAGDPA